MLKRPVTVTTGCMIYAFLKVVYQAWKTVFNRISKHQEEILKCDMQQVFLTNSEVFGAVMFDIQMSSITHTLFPRHPSCCSATWLLLVSCLNL